MRSTMNKIQGVRYVAVLIMILVAALLTSCAQASSDRYFEGERLLSAGEGIFRNETGTREIQIHPVDGEWEYQVVIDEEVYWVEGSPESVRVRFPDGRELRRTQHGSGSAGSAAPGTEITFADWDRVEALGVLVYGFPEPSASDRRSPGLGLAGILFLASGLLSALNPRLAFHLQKGWQFRDVEPSDLYLQVTRGVGVILMIAGAFLLWS